MAILEDISRKESPKDVRRKLTIEKDESDTGKKDGYM